MTDTVRITTALALGDDPSATARRAAAQAAEALGGPADLVAMFVSPVLCRAPDAVIAAVRTALSPRLLIGCMGEAVIGGGREVESEPAISVWAARLPGAALTPVRATAALDEADDVRFPGWPATTAAGADVVITLVDPFSVPIDRLLLTVTGAPGQPPVVGGMASGGRAPGTHVLFLDDAWYTDGIVGVAVAGTPVSVGVSQGCAPIGPEMVVTDAEEGGVVYELAGRPAIAKLEEVLEGLDPATRSLALNGLLAGLVINENVPEYTRGDFLVRGIVGGDRETGALMVGERVRVGQTVRLHVRDADSADEDLRSTLRATRQALDTPPAGALLFTCNGRGSHMFSTPDHDAAMLAEELDGAPAAGLFCNGEIGPVGGRSFVHSFTATMAVFGERRDR
jgi:small ligand-binding sensory domain FIST